MQGEREREREREREKRGGDAGVRVRACMGKKKGSLRSHTI